MDRPAETPDGTWYGNRRGRGIAGLFIFFTFRRFGFLFEDDAEGKEFGGCFFVEMDFITSGEGFTVMLEKH